MVHWKKFRNLFLSIIARTHTHIPNHVKMTIGQGSANLWKYCIFVQVHNIQCNWYRLDGIHGRIRLANLYFHLLMSSILICLRASGTCFCQLYVSIAVYSHSKSIERNFPKKKNDHWTQRRWVYIKQNHINQSSIYLDHRRFHAKCWNILSQIFPSRYLYLICAHWRQFIVRCDRSINHVWATNK